MIMIMITTIIGDDSDVDNFSDDNVNHDHMIMMLMRIIFHDNAHAHYGDDIMLMMMMMMMMMTVIWW